MKDREIFKEIIKDRSFLSGDDDELVLDKEELLNVLKDYKNKLREKISEEEQETIKDDSENEIKIKNQDVVLSKKQLRQLLEKHEEYVKNDYYNQLEHENEILLQNQIKKEFDEISLIEEGKDEKKNSKKKIKKKKHK